MQWYPMDTHVRIQNRQIGYMLAGVFYPAYPQYNSYRVLQKKERKLITVRDPNDCNRDIMAEIYEERASTSLTPPSVRTKCSNIMEAPVPQERTPPKEMELSTPPASEPCQSKPSICKRPGLLLFSIPPEEEVQQKKTEKVRGWKKEQSQTEVHKTQSPTQPREPVTFRIPLTEEEKEEVKKAKIVFGDFLFKHLTPTQPLKTTPPKEAELNTAPASNLSKRPDLLFSIPPEEEVQQNVNRWTIKAQSQTEVHKAQSQTHPREPVTSCNHLAEEEKEEVMEAKIVLPRDEKKTNKQENIDVHVVHAAPVEHAWTSRRSFRQRPRKLMFGDLLSLPLAHTRTKRNNILKANTLPEITPPMEAESNTASSSETSNGLLLFSIPLEEEVPRKKTKKANRRRRKEQNQAEVHKVDDKTQSQKHLSDQVTFCIPVMEKEKEEKGGKMAQHQTSPQPGGGDIVEAPVPLKTTPQMEAETDTAPVSETLPKKKSKKQVTFTLLPTNLPQKEEKKQAEDVNKQRSAGSD